MPPLFFIEPFSVASLLVMLVAVVVTTERLLPYVVELECEPLEEETDAAKAYEPT